MHGHVELITSTAVLILTISTIAVFIVYGYSILFYTVLIVALAFAFFNAWLIQKEHERENAAARRTVRRRKLKK